MRKSAAKKAPAEDRATAADRAKALELREEGMTLKEVAAELGRSVSTVHTWVGRKRRNPTALDRELFLEFIERYVTHDAELGVLINGSPIRDESSKRAFYRWREEATCPSHESAEAFLHAQGLLIGRDFEDWAAERGRCIWANGEPPAGYREEDDFWWEDLDSSDPKWREEALAQASTRGYLLPEGAKVSPGVKALLARRRRGVTAARIRRPRTRHGGAHRARSMRGKEGAAA